MQPVFHYIYSFYAWAYFVLFFFLVPLFALPFSLVLGLRRSFRLFFKVFVKIGLIVLFIYPFIKGKENIPKGRPVILLSSHPSFLDPFTLNGVLPGFFDFIVFAKVLFNPVSMLTVKAAGLITRDVSSPLLGAKVLLKAIKGINKGGSFILFISERASMHIEPVKVSRSVYKLIEGTDAVILPVFISGGIKLSFPKKPARPRIVIGKPLSKQDILAGGDAFVKKSILALSH